jgi:hypothetical protein
VTKFEPTKLINSILKDTKKLYDFEVQFDYKQDSAVIFGDEPTKMEILGDPHRVRYILSVLLKNAIDRNNQFHGLDLVKVSAEIIKSEQVILNTKQENTYY